MIQQLSKKIKYSWIWSIIILEIEIILEKKTDTNFIIGLDLPKWAAESDAYREQP